MTQLTQTTFCDENDPTKHGNCFAAALASLFDCSIEEVEATDGWNTTDSHWVTPFKRFLRSKGYKFAGTRTVPECSPFPPLDDIGPGVDGLFIVGGPSPRGDWVRGGHCAIYNSDGDMVHDPHPSGDGIVRVRDIYMIEPETVSI